MPHFDIGARRLLSVAAFSLLAGAFSTPASAGERGFFSIFESDSASDARGMTAYYGAPDDGYYGEPQRAAPRDVQDETRLGREYPATTREMVSDPTNERPGTITVDTENRYLYLSLANGQAMRYGIGVGRQGFTWKGRVRIGRKESWPDWTPPKEMLKRRPDLPRHMVGGEDNPLGARAMYLYAGDRDTMFRIHGSNEPWTIGQAVSSGCIRMTNDDVTDLFSRVKIGTSVVVL